MIHKFKVFDAINPLKIKEYDEFEFCDFSSNNQNTPRLSHIMNATLRNCYIKNCKFGPGIILVDCYVELTGYKSSFINKTLPTVERPVFWQCNLAQGIKKEIYAEHPNAVFYECNLMNCDLQPEHVAIKCNNMKFVLCKNLHPDFEELPDEPEHCDHVVQVDEIKSGDSGDSVFVYTYQNTRLA